MYWRFKISKPSLANGKNLYPYRKWFPNDTFIASAILTGELSGEIPGSTPETALENGGRED